MAPRDPFENSAYCKRYYRDNADAIRAKKRPQSRAYKQRVLLQRAIESARHELKSFRRVGDPDLTRSEACV